MSHTCSPAYSGIRMTILCVFFFFGSCSCLYQYYLVSLGMNWGQAQSYCRSTYTDLATVDTMEDMNQLMAAVGSFQGSAWIGLNDNEWSWTWSTLEGDQPITNPPIDSWHFTNPSNPRNQWELCGAQQGDNWWDLLCNLTQPFVCYDMDNSSSPPTKNYVYIDQAMNWHDAQAYCRKNHTDLASAMSKPEADSIKKVIPPPVTAFIGLHRPTWTWWSDSSVHTFDYWIQGRPLGNTGDCAATVIAPSTVGQFMEYDCGTILYFICYNKKPPMTYISRFKLTALQSTVDLNDPAVTGAILKLASMEEKVKQTGVNVTWIEQPGGKIFYKEKN